MAERSQKTLFLLFAADLAIFGRLLQSLKVAAGQWNFVQRLLDTLRDTISNFKPLASQFQEIYSFATKSGPICCNLPQPVDLPEEHPLKVDRGGQNVPVYQFSCSVPEVKPPNLIGLHYSPNWLKCLKPPNKYCKPPPLFWPGCQKSNLKANFGFFFLLSSMLKHNWKSWILLLMFSFANIMFKYEYSSHSDHINA